MRGPTARADAPAPPIPTELLRATAVLAEPPGPGHTRLAELLGLDPTPDEADFTELFVLQLRPYASIYLGPEGMLGGVARASIAGFWRALGRVPPTEPDHLSALLGLYAALLDAAHETGGAEGVLLRQSHEALLHEHLASWLFAYLGRVRETGPASYRGWADVLEEIVLRDLARSEPPAARARHLGDAPELPDPRRDGGAAFLSGLLAPVRSGVILTRRDLGGIARELGLGVRLGERRYVLEHLLGLDAAGVLAGIADEARRQGAAHARRGQLAGAVAAHWSGRAERTASLLDELAHEGSAVSIGTGTARRRPPAGAGTTRHPRP